MEDHSYLGMKADPQLRLKSDVLMLQLKGAGYAAVFCIVCALAVTGLWAVGLLLPEESKEADDPTPFSYVLPAEDTRQA